MRQEVAAQEHGAEELHGAGAEAGLTMEELPEWISHHIGDDRYIEFAGGHWDLAALAVDPIRLGPVVIDLSPTRQFVVMLLVAVLLALVFVPVARTIRRRGVERAPGGFPGAMEAVILYFRDEVVRPNIGHGADRFTPFILTIFFFVLGMNVIGLTPLGITPTANLSVTAGARGDQFRREPRSRGSAPSARRDTRGRSSSSRPGSRSSCARVMLAILTPVEFLGKLAKPFALAVRLLANMTAGTSSSSPSSG